MHFSLKMLAVLLCVVSLLLLRSASAQSTNASLSGQVTDVQGLVVVGAEVDAENQATNVVYSTKTNGEGFYSLPDLPPGTYEVHILKDGFRTLLRPGIELHVQDARALNATLQLGDKAEIVRVEGGISLINTTDAAVSTVVDRKYVENIPLNGRSFQSLLTLVPGVVAVPVNSGGGVGYSGEISVNGQRTEANYFTVDGVSANTGSALFPGTSALAIGAGISGAVPGESALGTTQSMVSIDALQEFRATTSTYSAEFGRMPGGQFSFSTRSGTNDWHGSLFDYFRNDAMDASNWFNGFCTPGPACPLPKAKERQNDFGGVFGGPIIKNKTFFFFSYEGLRLFTPQGVNKYSVPDASLRTNAPAPLQPVLNAFPLPNGGEDGLNDGLAFYNQTVSFPSSLDAYSIRIDDSFNEKFRVFGRYSETPSETSTYSEAVKSTSDIHVRTITLGTTNLITAKQLNELRFNITQNNVTSTADFTNLDGATPFDIRSLPGLNGSPFPKQGSLFTFFLAFGGTAQNFGVEQFLVSPRNTQRQYNLTDNYTWTVGSHSFKFGLDWRRLATYVTPVQVGEIFIYFNESSVLNNNAQIAQNKSQSPGPVEPVNSNYSAFVQDDWKASRRLSLSLGVRWDVNPPPGNLSGPAPYTVTQITDLATTQLAPANTPLWNTTYSNFAPRVGMALQLRQTPGRETVLRGGFGTFYDLGVAQGSQGFSGVGFSSFSTFPNQSFPLTSTQLQAPTPSVAAPYNNNVFAFDPNLKLPYTWQWSVALEQALGSKQAISLSYVGSAGRRLLTQFEYFPQKLGNTNFQPGRALLITSNRASSDYDALQVQYHRTLSHGLQALASYTWSHSIDNASSNFILFQLLRSSSDFDVRHSFQAGLTYEIPGTYTNPFLSAIAKHWALDARISARSAFPVNILGSLSFDPSTQQFVRFQPNVVSGQPLYLYGSLYPGGRIINFNAFQAAPAGTQGNLPRNYARGFDAVQADVAVRREFPIAERLRLQFRGEAFNVLNHPNFGTITNTLSSGPKAFGYATNTLNQSLGGLNALYQIGGPRSIQLALKLLF